MDRDVTPAPPRSRLYRLVCAPVTWYRFAFFFKLAGERHPRWLALRYTWLTL